LPFGALRLFSVLLFATPIAGSLSRSNISGEQKVFQNPMLISNFDQACCMYDCLKDQNVPVIC
jgi:hypothetical protein